MYGVLVVDDEKYIRKSIINRIRWEECGTEVIGEASQGNEAYEMLSLNQPGIVITDIRMPGMDGLGLAEKIAEEYPHIKVIIISAYSDFEYAKRAIRYGVREYILKPVDEEELETALKRLCAELESEIQQYQIPEVLPETVAERKFQGDSCLMTSFYLPQVQDELYSEERIAQLYQTLKGRIEECFQEGELLLLREGSEEQCSFLWNGYGITEKKAGEVLRKIQQEKVSYPVGISGVFFGEQLTETELLQLQTEAVMALKEKLFGGNLIRFFSRTVQKKEALEKYKNDLLRLYDLSVQEKWEKVKSLLRVIVTETFACASSVLELEFLVGELIFVLERIARHQGYLYETRVLFRNLKRQDFLLQFDSVEELTEEMKKLSDTVLAYGKNEKRYDMLEEIRDYVQQHFAEDLSVAYIAERYHVNANYLSTVFKERNTIALSSYIEGVRMEKAKKFLKENLGNITETALAVGYSDPNYFTKVFRKYTGMTPSQWKKNQE